MVFLSSLWVPQIPFFFFSFFFGMFIWNLKNEEDYIKQHATQVLS